MVQSLPHPIESLSNQPNRFRKLLSVVGFCGKKGKKQDKIEQREESQLLLRQRSPLNRERAQSGKKNLINLFNTSVQFRNKSETITNTQNLLSKIEETSRSRKIIKGSKSFGIFHHPEFLTQRTKNISTSKNVSIRCPEAGIFLKKLVETGKKCSSLTHRAFLLVKVPKIQLKIPENGSDLQFGHKARENEASKKSLRYKIVFNTPKDRHSSTKQNQNYLMMISRLNEPKL